MGFEHAENQISIQEIGVPFSTVLAAASTQNGPNHAQNGSFFHEGALIKC
jgi:hypothetical protein